MQGGTAGQRHARDRGDRGQRFAAEAVAGDALQIVERGDLAGGMAGERQRQVVGFDAGAVVGDADQPDAAFLQLHVDFRRAGVEAVLEQFLEHRSGPLHDFAGGNLADEQVG